jgi:VanZ like family
VIYATGLLWPFAIRIPTWVANGAAWTSAGTLRFDKPGLAVSPVSPAWLETSRDRSRFRVSLWARTFSPQQNGPARLFTLARDTHAQNVVIGQAGDDLVVRLRGLCRGFRAQAIACPKQLQIRNVFATSAWVDIDLLVEPNRVMLQAGDQPPLEMRTAGRPLRGWDAEHRLALGNDVSGLRPWLGELGRVTIETPLGLDNWLDPAKLELPNSFWLLDRQPKLLPFYHVSTEDVIVNLLLYVPLAVLIAGCFRTFGTAQLLSTSFAILIISSMFEFAQLFVETRNFSVTDIFLNSVGGTTIVYLIYIILAHRHR